MLKDRNRWTASFAILAFAPVGAAAAQQKQFNVPTQPAASGIREFARQADIQILVPARAAHGETTGAVSGAMSVKEGLRRLLNGTALHIRANDGQTVVLRKAELERTPTSGAHPVASTRYAAQLRTEPVVTTHVDAIIAEPAVARAQTSDDEIIVTARKREETALQVPVTLTAVGAKELERRGVNTVDAIARLVPHLVVGEGDGTAQGGSIALRGIAGADANPLADQAVAFNIDGVQIARSSVRRLGAMDIAQIEVLKGPQALYFGKNSPGGIIAIKTADPTSRFEAMQSIGYEFYGNEIRGEGFVSGPVADGLGLRIAGYISDLKGYVKNVMPHNHPLARQDRTAPDRTEYAIRGTLRYDPGTRFDARFKLTYNRLTGGGYAADAQLVGCPGPTPQLSPFDDCKLDNKNTKVAISPVWGQFAPVFLEEPYSEIQQLLGSLDMNYELTEYLKLTSLTGYYNYGHNLLDNAGVSSDVRGNLPAYQELRIKELSQEIRLATSFDGPINFLVGAHYQKVRARTEALAFINAATPSLAANSNLIQRGRAWSIFGQASWNIVPTLELSVGGRYSNEHKRLPVIEVGTGLVDLTRRPVATLVSRKSWNNFSPEATLAWRPTGNLTMFASYKKGFLSGGFNSQSGFAGNLSYDQQLIKGGEVGVKALLLDNRLRVNVSIYDYDIKGLQVTSSVNLIQTTSNAGRVSVRGAEADFAFRVPGIEGLSVRGTLAYNHARYDVFTIACYAGQSIAAGCDFGPPNAAGRFLLQNLAGTQVVRAPDWTGGGGVGYEFHAGGLKVGLSTDTTFSGGYFTAPTSPPLGRQKKYALVDAAIQVGADDDRWNVALIGRNLADNYYTTRISSVTGTGTASGFANSLPADWGGPASRGREVLLRLRLRQ